MPITHLKVHAIFIEGIRYFDDQDIDELFNKIDSQLNGVQVTGNMNGKQYWPQYSGTNLLQSLLKELKLSTDSIIVAREEPIEINKMYKVLDILYELTEQCYHVANIDVVIIDGKYVLTIDAEY